jgi:alpha-galactosidase
LTRITFLCVAVWSLVSVARAAEPTEPVKVFILAGQSNMEGHGIVPADPNRNGGKGSLEYLVRESARKARFSHLVAPDAKWKVRDDVWITYLDRSGPLTVGFGAKPDRIGPELGFGWVVGEAIKEPVLLVKCAWGGKSLAADFRPPSAGKPSNSLGQKQDAAVEADPTIVGKYYHETVALTKASLARVSELVPGSDGRYELVGFGWHQGWNDRINDQFNAEYEQNMVHFIHDMRRDLGVPNLPFVIAETGMSGWEEKHPRALAHEGPSGGSRASGIQRQRGLRRHTILLATRVRVAQRPRLSLEHQRRDVLPHRRRHGPGYAAAVEA